MFITKYLTQNPYTSLDIERVLDIVSQIYYETAGVVDVCIYLNTKGDYDVLNGVTSLSINGSNDTFQYGVLNTMTGKIITYRTFPNLKKPTIVVSVCVSDHELEKLDNNDLVKAAFVVPDSIADCEHWLILHNAKNLENGEILGGQVQVPEIVKRAVGWLIAEKRSIHPLDNMHIEAYIKDAANVVNHLNSVCPADDVIRHCIERGLNMSEASVVARIISRVPHRGYPISPTANFEYMVSWIDDVKWESINVN